MRLVCHIEELMLHGFRASERHAIAEALQRELQALLAAAPPPMPRRAADLGALAAPEARLGATAAAQGRAIAGAVHGALAGGRR